MQVLANPRHEKFCALVATGVRPSEAYVAIGYSENGSNQAASRLLRRTDVRARVSELHSTAQEIAVERCALSRVWVLERLMENVRRAMQEQPVFNSKGQPTGEYRYEGSVAIRALELLGREVGLFTERSESKIMWDGDLASLSGEQLAKLTASLEQIAFKDDPAGLEEWRRTRSTTLAGRVNPIC